MTELSITYLAGLKYEVSFEPVLADSEGLNWGKVGWEFLKSSYLGEWKVREGKLVRIYLVEPTRKEVETAIATIEPSIRVRMDELSHWIKFYRIFKDAQML